MKALFILVSLCLSQKAVSQQKYIEVAVADTVLVKPDNFIYRIMINRNTVSADSVPVYDSYLKTDAEGQRDRQKLKDSLVLQLKRKKFRLVPPGFTEAYQQQEYEEYKQQYVDVQTSSADSVRMLYEMVSADEKLSGKINSMSANDEAPWEKRLYTKLIKSAQIKAATLAQLGKLKTGAIISITEGREKNGWTIYPPLSGLSGMPRRYFDFEDSHDFIDSNNMLTPVYPISNSIVVRFAAE